MKNESIKPWTTRSTKFSALYCFFSHFSGDVVIDLKCSIRGFRKDSSNKTAVVPNFALYPRFVEVAQFRTSEKHNMAYKLCKVLRKLLKFSLNTALRNTREIASQFSLSLFATLDSRIFSAGASRILVHALHATRLSKTNFSHAMDLFP